ncbi:ABC transporter substrate-binding protein [Geomicrobium sediminis]|uniref:Thiamine pyrimidine synthase n=1 Tax=Geomicrobium sediminis TaxID=1347788 RepID=A0ABS2PD77_9BACL|nr:ABC transporter substrate-binding protein [Geomicrobium sediminis]MBM7633076.1 ABC-type nitrate/sulfonate/bicarbonate transport system substrate-binding protein [Geomicrobium sediminis]
MQKISVGLEWFMNPDHIPLMIGMEKGWFANEGIEVTMIEPEDHFDAIDEIKAGKMDIAITEPLHLVEDRAAGEPVVGFARFLHTNGGVMYNKAKGINRPVELIGKRIQYPGAPGLGGLAIVKTMVEHDGGSCELEQFKPVNNGFYHTDALAEDKADAATLVFRNFEVAEAKHRGLDVDYFALKDFGVPDFCQLIFITSPEVFERQKHVLASFMKVIRKSIDYLYENSDEAKTIYYAFTQADESDPLNQSIMNATLPCFTYDFSMTEAYYDDLQTWLKKSGKIGQVIEPTNYWTNELIHTVHSVTNR